MIGAKHKKSQISYIESFKEKSSKNAQLSPESITIMNPSDHNETAPKDIENHCGYSFATTPDNKEMDQTQTEPCDLRQRKLKSSDSSNQRSDNSKLSFDTMVEPSLKSRHEDENGFAENNLPAESQQYCETGVNSQQSEQSKNDARDDAQQYNKHAKCDALVILTVIISAILIKLIIDYLF